MQYTAKVFYIFIGIILFSIGLFASSTDMLHKASSDIRHNADTKAVVESLYTQMRPRVLIHNTSLDSAIINQKTKEYIQNRYAPMLIANYAHLYNKLVYARKNFTLCKDPQPIDVNASLQQALCKVKQDNMLIIRYLTRIPPNAWKISVEYHFLKQKETLILKAIQLSLPPKVKVRIEGI
jgi:hypothetical protein